MSVDKQLTNFTAAGPISDADQVYVAQGAVGVAQEKAAFRGALAATPVFPTFASLQTAVSEGTVTIPRKVQVTADETMGGITMDYSVDASGNFYYSPMIKKVL
jgi:hypothetical protein